MLPQIRSQEFDQKPASRGRGRPPNREKYHLAVADAESELVENLPALTSQLLKAALATEAETCPVHGEKFGCRFVLAYEDFDDETGAPRGAPIEYCHQESTGRPSNFAALKYSIDRVMGIPKAVVDQHMSMELVKKIGLHVADAFNACNELETPEERANLFAQSIAQLWVLVSQDA